MTSIKLLLTVVTVLQITLRETSGHGMVLDPPARASAWRKGFKTPKNNDDNQIWCGGATTQHLKNGGKCGVCGDNFASSRPRANENGGRYGTGTIVQSYTSRQVTNVTVHITANHAGKFYFSVCPLSHPKELETEECFKNHPVKLADGQEYYSLNFGIKGDIPITIVLPKDVSNCAHCVFRWQWIAGNNNGKCKDGKYRQGCGPQEEFRTCSDISIL